MRERGSASSPGMGEAATRRKVALPLLCCRKLCPSRRPPPHFSGPLNPTPWLPHGATLTVQGQARGPGRGRGQTLLRDG